MDCPFCGIVAGDEIAYEVYRDEETVAFLDRHPAAEGHTLVASTTHREGLPDATGDEVAALFRTVRTVASGLVEAMDADGVSVFQSTGAAAGQDVFHLHVHVIPRFEDDDIRFAPTRDTLTEEDGTETAGRIRETL